MTKGQRLRQLLLKGLTGLLALLLIAVICCLLILVQPKPEEKEKAAPQPMLTASPALEITRESDLRTLAERFPVPVLGFMSGSGMTFVSGTSADLGLKGGFGRIATLYWQTAEGEPVMLQSIYPASAVSVLDNGYHFSPVTGPTLFGTESVRMENSGTVRVHAATESGLYAFTVPKALAPKLSSLSRSLLLFTVNSDG